MIDKIIKKILLFRLTFFKKIDEIIKSEIYLFLSGHQYVLRSWNMYSLIFIKESYDQNN